MRLVKFITDDDGNKHTSKDWHLVRTEAGAPRSVCTGEVFGYGEGAAKYKEKYTGKITCVECKAIVKWFKSIKL